MSLLDLPKDALRIILHKLDNVEDLVSFSYLNKATYEFCRSNKNFLLRKWDRKLYDFKIETRVTTVVVNLKVLKQTQYVCPLCLAVYPGITRVTCNARCIDCGRRFCRKVHSLLGMSSGDNFYREEPLRIDKHGRKGGGDMVYRCFDCHLFEFDLMNHNRIWTNRVFTPEEEATRGSLITEKKKQEKLLKQRNKGILQ